MSDDRAKAAMLTLLELTQGGRREWGGDGLYCSMIRRYAAGPSETDQYLALLELDGKITRELGSDIWTRVRA